MDKQRACHICPALSCLRTAGLINISLPAALTSWIQVLLAAASVKQLSTGTQVPVTVTYSVSVLLCEGFAVSTQHPPEGLQLALGTA